MVHPSTDNFWRLRLGWAGRPFYLGVYLVMRAIKTIAAALLVAAAAVTVAAAGPDIDEKREHLLQGGVEELREHLI